MNNKSTFKALGVLGGLYNKRFTFRALGLHKVKDISENNLREAYKDYKDNPLKYVPSLMSAIFPRSVQDLKRFHRYKIIETARTMKKRFTFRELGLHKVKDIGEDKLRKAYEELWNHPEYDVEYANCDVARYDVVTGIKDFYKRKAIELAKTML